MGSPWHDSIWPSFGRDCSPFILPSPPVLVLWIWADYRYSTTICRKVSEYWKQQHHQLTQFEFSFPSDEQPRRKRESIQPYWNRICGGWEWHNWQLLCGETTLGSCKRWVFVDWLEVRRGFGSHPSGFLMLAWSGVILIDNRLFDGMRLSWM